MPLTIAWLTLLLAACGAEGTDAPVNAGPSLGCPTIDERLQSTLELLELGDLVELGEVLARLKVERDGVRLERALSFVLGLLQALPREEAETFEFALVYDLLDDTRAPVARILDLWVDGSAERRRLFPVLRDMFLECRRDSIILTVNDIMRDDALLTAAGDALTDDRIVGLLANVSVQGESGRAGFVALIRAVVNAVQSPNFDIGQLRSLLGFLDADEPPISDLLDALETYLQGEALANLRTTLDCLEGQSADGIPGVDVLGHFLYDLVTLDGLDLGQLLGLLGPFIERLNTAELQTLLTAVVDRLLESDTMRELGVELVVFFLREDNLLPTLRSAAVLVRTGAIDELLNLAEGLTIRCPDSLSASEGER